MTNKIKLRPTGHPRIFEDVDGGREPLFERTVDHGEVRFWHQSGYGYLPESRVEVLNSTDGVSVPAHHTKPPAGTAGKETQ